MITDQLLANESTSELTTRAHSFVKYFCPKMQINRIAARMIGKQLTARIPHVALRGERDQIMCAVDALFDWYSE